MCFFPLFTSHIHFIHIDPSHSTPLHSTLLHPAALLLLLHSIPPHSPNTSHSPISTHLLSSPPTMTSAPRPINALAPGGGNTTRSNTEESLFSSSPRLDAATRLLSTSPSPRPSSRNNNTNQALTPSSSWRSPSTLQNFRRLSTDGYQSGGENNNRLSLNAPIVGSYQSIYSLNADTPYSGMEIPADEASKVVKKHLVLSARNSFESDRALNNNGVGYDTGDESGNESGTGSRSRAAPVDYNAAFKLPGGAITRDVYKWQADQENEQLRRAHCQPSFLFPTPDKLHSNREKIKKTGGLGNDHSIHPTHPTHPTNAPERETSQGTLTLTWRATEWEWE
ncbi:MAG: hypothetical protein BYD32DRAFT_311982 [Podila humilis]|nr:MAG: hypothetical protein BYD32DRAFT_311982 [Podila humilis]